MTDAQMRSDMEALMTRLVANGESSGGHATASRSCTEGGSTSRGHENPLVRFLRSLVSTRIGQSGHFSPLRTWGLRITSRWKYCAGLR